MRRSRPLQLAQVAASLAGIAAALATPGTVRADDPPCASLFPTTGPAGVDLQGACVANDLVENYTSTTSTQPDALWTLVLILGASWVAAVVVFAVWRFLAGRATRRLASVAPTAFWLCERCHSFNAADASTCYRCRAVRPDDPRLVDATNAPPWDQRDSRSGAKASSPPAGYLTGSGAVSSCLPLRRWCGISGSRRRSQVPRAPSRPALCHALEVRGRRLQRNTTHG
jgi:hypothetical protein